MAQHTSRSNTGTGSSTSFRMNDLYSKHITADGRAYRVADSSGELSDTMEMFLQSVLICPKRNRSQLEKRSQCSFITSNIAFCLTLIGLLQMWHSEGNRAQLPRSKVSRGPLTKP